MAESEPKQSKEEILTAFRAALEDLRLCPGKQVELVTFADDTVSGFKRTYSHICPLRPEQKLNAALTAIISELVPEGESRETLEAGFQSEPDTVKHRSHYDLAISEWPTVFDNVSIGVRAVRDQRSESVRSWYLRNTSRDKGARK